MSDFDQYTYIDGIPFRDENSLSYFLSSIREKHPAGYNLCLKLPTDNNNNNNIFYRKGKEIKLVRELTGYILALSDLEFCVYPFYDNDTAGIPEQLLLQDDKVYLVPTTRYIPYKEWRILLETSRVECQGIKYRIIPLVALERYR